MDELLMYLKEINCEKQLEKLSKKLENKKVILYGNGLFFQRINEHYNLKTLDIIGVSDIRYYKFQEGEEFMGYKIIPLNKIADYNPDYVLISTLEYKKIMADLKKKTFKGTQIKVRPLLVKPLITLLKELLE